MVFNSRNNTITNYDPFGRDYMMYTFTNSCKEVKELEYDDGLTFIYFYTDGHNGGSEEIRAMLRYFQSSTPDNVTNEDTREIHQYTNKVKLNPEVRQEFMKFEEIIAYAKAEARDEGKSDSIIELLAQHGQVPDSLREQITAEHDSAKLSRWLITAAKSVSIEEFAEKM